MSWCIEQDRIEDIEIKGLRLRLREKQMVYKEEEDKIMSVDESVEEEKKRKIDKERAKFFNPADEGDWDV